MSIINNATISSDALGSGKAGNVAVNAGSLAVTGSGAISSDTFGSGNGGSVAIQAGTLAIGPDGEITTDTSKSGNGGSIAVTVTGALSIDGTSSTIPTGITALTVTGSTGHAGNIIVNAGSLTIGPNGQISTDTFGTGKGGDIAVTVAGALSIDGRSSTVPTGITALTGSNGDAGNVVVSAGSLSIVTNGLISVDTLVSNDLTLETSCTDFLVYASAGMITV